MFVSTEAEQSAFQSNSDGILFKDYDSVAGYYLATGSCDLIGARFCEVILDEPSIDPTGTYHDGSDLRSKRFNVYYKEATDGLYIPHAIRMCFKPSLRVEREFLGIGKSQCDAQDDDDLKSMVIQEHFYCGLQCMKIDSDWSRCRLACFRFRYLWIV